MWMLNIEEQLHVSYEEDNKHDDCVACVKSRLNLITLWLDMYLKKCHSLVVVC